MLLLAQPGRNITLSAYVDTADDLLFHPMLYLPSACFMYMFQKREVLYFKLHLFDLAPIESSAKNRVQHEASSNLTFRVWFFVIHVP